MATTMEGSFKIPAGIETVWANLNDPETLRACITGCHTLDRTSETTFAAAAKVRIALIPVTFKVNIELHDVDAPNGCRIVGTGQGGLAGFAKGEADVRLTAVPGGTLVTYAVEAHLGGKLEKFAGRLIDSVAKSMADRFFTAFAAAVAPHAAAAH